MSGPDFQKLDLIPVIAQDAETRDVLMLAYMNAEAYQETLATGRVCYYSRNRQKLWRKGESSGQQQLLISAAFDCDGDTLLLQVNQTGPACHTGRRNCFFRAVRGGKLVTIAEVEIDPKELYGE